MIYIHIPFCRKICHYCDFHHSAALGGVSAMVGAIGAELLARRDYLTTDQVQTLYFGGGTPSVLTIEQVADLVCRVRKLWPAAQLSEITLEANPDDISPEYAAGLLAAGINRVSLGVQSFVDEHLALMNRRHTGRQAVQAVRTLQNEGFDNITIDLIYAMPFLTDDQWQSNLEQALNLDVQHISAYHLTIEPHTVFGKRGLQPVADEVSQRHFALLRQALCGAGFEHYEVSNFALAGRRAVHNSGYWAGKPYLGVGPSAHSYNGAERSWNVASNKLYVERQDHEKEVLTDADKYNELIMTRLRTADGLLTPDLALIHRAKRFLECGDLILERDTLRIPPEKFLISDYIISELFL